MKTSRFSTLMCVVTLVTAFLLVVFWTPQAMAESTLVKVKNSGKMLCGIRSDKPPMGYYDEKGNLVGLGVDIAKAVAEKLGVGTELIPVNAQNRTPYLNTGRIDVEFGTTTPTKQREEVTDFTIVINWDHVVLLVRKGESKEYKNYGPPKKVSAPQGNYAIPIFKNLVPNADFVIFPSYTDCMLALLNNKVDAVLEDKFTAEQYVKRYTGRLEVGESIFEDPNAFLVRQDDSKWRNQLNWILQELWYEGRFQKLYEKHYGYPPPFKCIWSERRLQPGVIKEGE